MANLQEKLFWEPGIYQLETSDPVLAGPDGIDNLQGKQLANRTVYLKDQVEQLASGKQPAGNAAKLSAARKIEITGDGSWNVSFDGSKDVSGQLTLRDSGVAPGDYGMVTVDAKGRVTKARQMSGDDMPAHDWGKISTGKPTTLAGYGITDAASKDTGNRVWANAFRASKGLPTGDDSSSGFAFGSDGDTGLFADASGSSANMGTNNLFLHIDSTRVFQVSNAGRVWASSYGFLDDKFASKVDTFRTQGQPVDKVDWNTLLEPGVYSIVDTTFSGLNAPPASYFWGTLQVMRGSPRGSVGGVTQIYTTHGGMAVWLRTAWNDQAWQPWQQLWHSGNQVFSSLIEGNGYQRLPSGLIIQWGQGSLTATLGLPSGFATALFATGEITFRTSFPTACCSIMVNGNENSVSGQTQEGYFWVGGRSKEKATIGYTQTFGSAGVGERTAFDWIAIGY
ncbi:hypothetical protein LQR30_05925 [Chromobacterium piscinae]|uniref:pyocin knob domain-containing protein n=1 Tax=Chromobacterium piscinae TaxID=686831 RepID=UPI001E38ABF6|nr:pyocin knob domain-containing protein [Chromobacterium piscinae]MCD4503634.1 hypothetical protein [Chromobacterium piscinae]